MPRALSFVLLFLLPVCSAAQAVTDWKPAAGPLMTRWAKDVDPKNPLPEHPRPHMTGREWMSLNGVWQHYVGTKGVAEANLITFKPILVPFPIESALSGVMRRLEKDQYIQYHRSFTLPAAFRGKRVILHFGAVDWSAKVRVNTHDVGTHQGGYDSFSF